MAKIPFLKMNGVGNDFVIIDERQQSYNLSCQNIINICDRKNGIGCDQLVIIQNSAEANCFMAIYNQDGSRSATCGNATRCVAAIIFDEDKNLDQISIATLAGSLECWKSSQNMISVRMGIPEFSWSKIPLSKAIDTQNLEIFDYKFYCVNVGNPHAVTFLTKMINDDEFLKIGPQIENHQLFPEKINVEFAVIKSDSKITARVWERGSGETKACGSGACAIAITAIKNNFVNKNEIEIEFPGGSTFIKWPNDQESVIMTGTYIKEFSGYYEL